jgi:uncharacterized protein YkwD
LQISHFAGRSVPFDDGSGTQPAPRNSHRAAALVIASLVILAAFILTAPYLSSGLKQGYSILSQLGSTGPGTQTSTSVQGANATTVTSAEVQCSSVVSVKSLAPPDITNGSADISYPSNYCTLAAYALEQINSDRAANGTGPVALDYNQAAQQHADSMLYYGYFSHYDTQGYKPYMRYSLLGGVGADFENVAYFSYSVNHFTSTSAVEGAIKALEHSMVYNDSSCCANGHRYNILSPLHNMVSVGVAYNGTAVLFDEEFENDYLGLNFSYTGPSLSNPYYVTMIGAPTQHVPTPNSIYIAFDSTPSPETPAQLDNAPHEYGPGTLVGGVVPRFGILGDCAQFASGTTVCADSWKFTSTSVDIAFSLEEFIKNYGPGVYTIYLITGSSTSSAITTISVFVS